MVFRVIVNVTSVFVIVPLTDFVLVHVKVHEDDVKFPSCLRDVIIESTSPCMVMYQIHNNFFVLLHPNTINRPSIEILDSTI